MATTAKSLEFMSHPPFLKYADEAMKPNMWHARTPIGDYYAIGPCGSPENSGRAIDAAMGARI
jgi:hypothetical protein